MFKKKPNLPPRPQHPSASEISSDVSLLTNDDPLFAIAKKLTEKRPKAENSQKQEDIYEKIKKLFNMHEDLEKVMKNVDASSSGLKEKELEILSLSDDLKNQALKALV